MSKYAACSEIRAGYRWSALSSGASTKYSRNTRNVRGAMRTTKESPSGSRLKPMRSPQFSPTSVLRRGRQEGRVRPGEEPSLLSKVFEDRCNDFVFVPFVNLVRLPACKNCNVDYELAQAQRWVFVPEPLDDFQCFSTGRSHDNFRIHSKQSTRVGKVFTTSA